MPRTLRYLASPCLLISLVLTVSSRVDAQATSPTLELGDAAHLLGRVGLGADPSSTRRLVGLTRPDAVDRLLDTASAKLPVAAPDWTMTPPTEDFAGSDLTAEERRQKRQELQRSRGRQLKAWWFEVLLETDQPVSERMTLFWHNHFTSGLRKVRSPRFMFRQNQLLREHALGNFRILLSKVARDPAMLQYLDGQRSRKNKPNENFARELLELFTLGEGHYTERDIKETARAFTGWRVQRRTGEAQARPRQQDRGVKEFMGRRGRFDGDDIIAIILDQPQTAEFIVAKLWRQFVSPNPDPAEVQRLSKGFRNSDYEIRPVLRSLLLTDAFWSVANRGVLTKSPVDLLVGTVRTFDLPVWDINDLATLSRRLGQDLLDPPNVKGWPGGAAWISSTTLLARRQFLEAVTTGGAELPGRRQRDQRPTPSRRFAIAWLEELEEERSKRSSTATALLLRTPPLTTPNSDLGPAEHVWHLITDPAFQVK